MKKIYTLTLITLCMTLLSFSQDNNYSLGSYVIGKSTFAGFEKSLTKQKLKLKITSDDREIGSNNTLIKAFLFSSRKEGTEYRSPPFGPPFSDRIKRVVLINYKIKNIVFDRIELYFLDDVLSSIKGIKKGYFSENFLGLNKIKFKTDKVSEPQKTICYNQSVELKNIIIRFSNQYIEGNYYLYETMGDDCKPFANCSFEIDDINRNRRISTLEIIGLKSDRTVEIKDSF